MASHFGTGCSFGNQNFLNDIKNNNKILRFSPYIPTDPYFLSVFLFFKTLILYIRFTYNAADFNPFELFFRNFG